MPPFDGPSFDGFRAFLAHEGVASVILYGYIVVSAAFILVSSLVEPIRKRRRRKP